MSEHEKIWAVVPAAGTGSRMKEALADPIYDDLRKRLGETSKKQFIVLKGKELLVYSLEVLEAMEEIDGIILVTGSEDLEHCRLLMEQYHLTKVKKIVEGGSRRQNSVFLGLSALPKDCTMAVIHDGARPFATQKDVRAAIAAAKESGGAILAVPVKDTIKIVTKGVVESTPERSMLYSAQTPQVFRYPEILEGYRHAVVMGDFRCTDDSQVMEKYMDTQTVVVDGSYENIKVTTPEDLKLADQILNFRMCHENRSEQ